MKWVNHILIAGSTTAIVAPPLVPVAILGSTAPDWLESVYKLITGHHIKHRGSTHYVLFWIIGILFTYYLWDYHSLFIAFFYGGLTHVICDSFTVSGVPLSPWSDRRFHLFGGRLRTGEPGEYILAFCIVGVCAVLGMAMHTITGWYPFFYDWSGLYESGLIDGSEWKTNRFRLI